MVLWLLLQDIDPATQVQIQDETVCISLGINTFGNGMNPIILHSAMSK